MSQEIKLKPRIHDSMKHPIAPEVGGSGALSIRAIQGNTIMLQTQRTSRVEGANRYFQASDESWQNIFSEVATKHLRLGN